MIKKVEKGVRDFMKQYKVTLTSEIEGLDDSHALRRLLTATIISEIIGKPKRTPRRRKVEVRRTTKAEPKTVAK